MKPLIVVLSVCLVSCGACGETPHSDIPDAQAVPDAEPDLPSLKYRTVSVGSPPTNTALSADEKTLVYCTMGQTIGFLDTATFTVSKEVSLSSLDERLVGYDPYCRASLIGETVYVLYVDRGERTYAVIKANPATREVLNIWITPSSLASRLRWTAAWDMYRSVGVISTRDPKIGFITGIGLNVREASALAPAINLETGEFYNASLFPLSMPSELQTLYANFDSKLILGDLYFETDLPSSGYYLFDTEKNELAWKKRFLLKGPTSIDMDLEGRRFLATRHDGWDLFSLDSGDKLKEFVLPVDGQYPMARWLDTNRAIHQSCASSPVCYWTIAEADSGRTVSFTKIKTYGLDGMTMTKNRDRLYTGGGVGDPILVEVMTNSYLPTTSQ
jgi:hypothetical protein